MEGIESALALIREKELSNTDHLSWIYYLQCGLKILGHEEGYSDLKEINNALDNLRRVSVLGPGGINRERASFSIRDINSSQYGRIDPVRSPEGQNIGLVTYLALLQLI